MRPPLAGVKVFSHRLQYHLGRPLSALPHRMALSDLPHPGHIGSGLASAIRGSSCVGLSRSLAHSASFSPLMRASSLFFGAPKTSHLLVWKDLRPGAFLSSGFQVAAAEVWPPDRTQEAPATRNPSWTRIRSGKAIIPQSRNALRNHQHRARESFFLFHKKAFLFIILLAPNLKKIDQRSFLG